MIRYRASAEEIAALVTKEVPGWHDNAAKRTAKLIAAGTFDESSHIWSQVKPVFMQVQHDKCAFCERRFAAADHGGAIELDLEHFRPKSSVEDWPDGAALGFKLGRPSPTGYYWLANDLQNYVAACKKCNTPLKKNYFPIAGRRGPSPRRPPQLQKSEEPYLIYPLGNLDADPADVITFLGMVAKPAVRKSNGPRWKRAKVIIEFFKLNAREELREGRARMIVLLYTCLAARDNAALPQHARDDGHDGVEICIDERSPHSACAIAFVKLFEKRPVAARRQRDACSRYLKIKR